MPEIRPDRTRICPDCDGFASVAIDSPSRKWGFVVYLDCSACRGWGKLPIRHHRPATAHHAIPSGK